MLSPRQAPTRTVIGGLLATALAAAPPLRAQDAVTLQAAPGGVVLANALPRRIIAFVRGLGPNGASAAQVVSVDASATTAITRGTDGLVVEKFDLISPATALPAQWAPTCEPLNAAATQPLIAAMQAQLSALPLEQRKEGRQALEMAASIAQLRNDRTRALYLLEHNDPVKAFYAEEGRQYATPQGDARREQQKWNSDLSDLTKQMTDMMKVYAQQAKAKYEVLMKDAKRYKELLDKSERLLANVTTNVGDVNAYVARDAIYHRTVADAIEAELYGDAAAPQVRAGVTRPCGGPAAVSDIMEVSSGQTDDVAVMVGELSFNAGGSQSTTRRVRGSDRWFAKFSWPAEASSATVRVRALKSTSWTTVPGSLRTDRASRASLVTELRGQVTTARTMYEETLNRAKGADHLKTIIVP